MLQQPSGILPVWVEDGNFRSFSFTESPEQGDWVLNVAPDEKTSTEGVRAGHMRFCHHRTSDRVRAQCFYMFGNAEPFLWRCGLPIPTGALRTLNGLCCSAVSGGGCRSATTAATTIARTPFAFR